MIGRKALKTRIDLVCTICIFDPRDNVFYHTLVQLVQVVGGDGLEDVSEWQMFPKWMMYGLDIDILASFDIRSWSSIYICQSLQNILKIAPLVDSTLP